MEQSRNPLSRRDVAGLIPGEWCDREAFVQGRDQVLRYARVYHDAMRSHRGGKICFVEDLRQFGRGCTILRLDSKEP